jgi:aerobic carbon-monoxide dehydrogenase medium subunit
MYPAQFTYHAPGSLDEVLSLMQEHGEDAKLLAGGHSLLPTMKLRLSTPAHLIDLKKLRSSLQYIRDAGDHIAIGALTTYWMLEDSNLVANKIPLLTQTVKQVGDMQVRNVGTIGGSVAHADPSGDPPAAMLALEANMVVRGTEGERIVPASDFFLGFFETAVGAGDVLTEIRVPVQRGQSSYQKFRHPASGYAVCGVAAVVETSGDTISKARIGVTGIGEKAYRATAVEQALEGKTLREVDSAAAQATEGIEPLGDSFADADYRSHLAKILTAKAVRQALQ